MTLVYLPLVLLLSYSFEILVAIGQDQSVARYAQEYIWPMIPAMYFLGLFDLSRRFLTCLQFSQGPMFAQIASSVFHLVLCIFWVRPSGLGVRGLGLATMITYISMWLLSEVYAFSIPTVRKALQWPSRETFIGWKDYLAISLPATIMLLAEGWAFNVLGVIAGLISVTDQAANTIMLQLIAVMFMVPNGIQSAACAIIGQQIGANQVSLAKEYFKVMSVAVLVLLMMV